jgi:peptide deformylase
MAIRNIRVEGDEVLRKKAREVEVIDDKIVTILKDMADTLHSTDNGVGLAAPQVGILKRIVVIDIGEGLMEIINPVRMDESGEQTYVEGCLSVPGVYGEVIRPAKVTVEYLDGKGRKNKVNADGMLAVVLSHEIDHLDGVLFKDKVVRYVDPKDLSDD